MKCRPVEAILNYGKCFMNPKVANLLLNLTYDFWCEIFWDNNLESLSVRSINPFAI